ncbi:hypothetical protein IFM89_008263 [Coptis chinensis]|uniref:Uncharacterized protein n=1 Tax=Coptis chinensis TaxID=261450 RepID=A0A835LYX0_9MAGN|nr:hypothetical protein IFM89_008263 [Coptis chinensis]
MEKVDTEEAIESFTLKAEGANQVAPSSPHVTSHLIDYSDTGRKLHGLKMDLEAAKFEIRELKSVAKNAVNRAEQAEKTKTAVEAQLRKWIEQKQKRREAAAEESTPKGSNLPKTNKLKLMNIVIVNMVKVTSDHHEEVIKVGISPSLKESESFQKFLYVIAGYPGDVRLDDSVWLFEDVYVFNSSGQYFGIAFRIPALHGRCVKCIHVDSCDRKELKLWVTRQGGYNHEE